MMKRAEKSIVYWPHAERRMQQRGVSRGQVREALHHPDSEGPALREDARRFEKRISRGRRLVVIAVESRVEFFVVSVFWR